MKPTVKYSQQVDKAVNVWRYDLVIIFIWFKKAGECTKLSGHTLPGKVRTNNQLLNMIDLL